mmetsp:Transcript_9513/g.14929  ORF Transcript_9513/g.14929 Transcript_9513/m.14929 type:complete len:353 (-) Transcript_9513:204-1262(-)
MPQTHQNPLIGAPQNPYSRCPSSLQHPRAWPLAFTSRTSCPLLTAPQLLSFLCRHSVHAVIVQTAFLGIPLRNPSTTNSNIVHRDLKPENLLLDSAGHLVVTDFGASKISTIDGEDIRTNSWVGTELYMAPEQLLGKEYGRVVDWWATGVLCWEMLTGENPFYHQNPEQVAAKVQKKKLSLPSHFGPATHSFLKGLLNRDPEQRLGKKGADDLKKHPFFAKAKGFSWRRILEKEDEPPFVIPELQEDPENVSRISDHYINAAPVLSPVSPHHLSPSSQALFAGFEWVSPYYSPAVRRMPNPAEMPSPLDLSFSAADERPRFHQELSDVTEELVVEAEKGIPIPTATKHLRLG